MIKADEISIGCLAVDITLIVLCYQLWKSAALMLDRELFVSTATNLLSCLYAFLCLFLNALCIKHVNCICEFEDTKKSFLVRG